MLRWPKTIFIIVGTFLLLFLFVYLGGLAFGNVTAGTFIYDFTDSKWVSEDPAITITVSEDGYISCKEALNHLGQNSETGNLELRCAPNGYTQFVNNRSKDVIISGKFYLSFFKDSFILNVDQALPEYQQFLNQKIVFKLSKEDKG